MIDIDDDFLHINTAVKKSCFMRLVALVWLPMLIFAGVVAGYLGYIAFNVEIHSVIMIGFILFIYLAFVKHNAHYASCRFNKRHEEMNMALKWYIKNNQLTIGDVTKANAPFDDFMKDFSASLRNDNFASVAAGVFPTLGILGTFISIALSMPDFSSQNSAMLEKEISLLLGGVGTAFYVSIYGIFLSLYWIYYEKSGMSRFEKNVQTLKENLRHYFWTKAEIEQLHFQKSMENFDKLGSIFTKIASNEFIDNIQQTLQQRLELFEGIIHHEQQALKQATGHLSKVNEEVETSVQTSEKLLDAYHDITLSMSQVSHRLDENNKLMGMVSDKLSHKEKKIEESVQALNHHITALGSALENISADNVKDLYGAVVQNLEIMRSESAKIGYAFNKHLDDFDEQYTKKLKTSLELIDSESAKIISQIAQLRLIDNR